MPRPPRAFAEGGIYQVYDRVTRGERVFAEDQKVVRESKFGKIGGRCGTRSC